MNARDRFEELLLDYVEDALTAPERGEFEALCTENPAWRSEAEVERGLVAMMKKVPRRRAPEGILAAALNDARLAPVVEMVPTPIGDGENSGRRSGAWFAPFAAAAAILIVAGSAVLLPRDSIVDRPATRGASALRQEAVLADSADSRRFAKTEVSALDQTSPAAPEAESFGYAQSPSAASDFGLNESSDTPLASLGDKDSAKEVPTRTGNTPLIRYDPTNGTVSGGGIMRSQNVHIEASRLAEASAPVTDAKEDEQFAMRSGRGTLIWYDPTNGTESRADAVRTQVDAPSTTMVADANIPVSGLQAGEAVAAVSAPAEAESKKQLAALIGDLRSDSGVYDSVGYVVLADFPTRPAASSYAHLSEPPADSEGDAVKEGMRYLVIDTAGERSVVPYLVSAIRLPDELTPEKGSRGPEGTRELSLAMKSAPKNLAKQNPGRAAREVAARTIDSEEALSSALSFFGGEAGAAKLKADLQASTPAGAEEAAKRRNEADAAAVLSYRFASIGDARKALASLLLMPSEKTPAIDVPKAYVVAEGTGAVLMIPRR